MTPSLRSRRSAKGHWCPYIPACVVRLRGAHARWKLLQYLAQETEGGDDPFGDASEASRQILEADLRLREQLRHVASGAVHAKAGP
jgi:hypothetical protein